ncbi:RHS repeat-associated core domain-containing protein [Kitasatospora hibisci]|uniref:RHS repeat-associated core domain-containing protein n=1 Tax=Kitasatospora hibisci TaxID=3369522 RepID=UPI0037550B87
MQDDGNFVVYDPQRIALWSSKTYVGAGSGYFAVLQDDGKFIVYAPGWQSKWSTPTWSAVDAANGATLTWDVEGKLASLTQGSATTSYVYDADGNQLIRRNPGKVTVNLGGGDELTYDTNSKTSTGTRYYTIPGNITLVRQGPDKLTYQFSDHHGTNSLSLDRDSLAETRRTTDPFGVTRGPGSLTTPWAGDKGYVGGLKDDTTGLTNLGARQYQPTTGRFLSPDPIFDAGDPLQWNAYAYSNNNPVNRSDPNGLKSEECGTLYKCGSAGTITMKNAAETTAERVDDSAYQRLVSSDPGFEEERKEMRHQNGLRAGRDYRAKTSYPFNWDKDGRHPYDRKNYEPASKTEMAQCGNHPVDCWAAHEVKDRAVELTELTYQGGPRGPNYPYGQGDTEQTNAFRHTVWQAMLTFNLGEERAWDWADAHEAYHARNMQGDHLADLVNNEKGRSIGLRARAVVPAKELGWNAMLVRQWVEKYVASEAILYVEGGQYARPGDFRDDDL